MPWQSSILLAWKYRRVLISAGLVAMAGGYFAGRLIPFHYRAEALVMIAPRPMPERPEVRLDLEEQRRLNSLASQLLTNQQLQKMIGDLQLYRKAAGSLYPQDLRELLRNDLKISLERGWTQDQPGAFRISYEGTDARAIVTVVSRAVDLFLASASEAPDASGAGENLDNQLHAAERRVAAREARLAELRTKARWSEGDTRPDRIRELRVNQEEALLRARQNRVTAAASLESAQRASRELSTPRTDPRLTQLRAEYEAARERYSEQHPDVRALAEKIHALASLAPAATPEQARARERVDEFQAQLNSVETEIAARENALRLLEADMNRVEKRARETPLEQAELAMATHERDLSLADYQSILQRRSNAPKPSGARASGFLVIEPAALRSARKSWRSWQVSLLFGVLGLALTYSAICGFQFRFGAILGSWDLPGNVPVIGSIPHLSPMRANDGAVGIRTRAALAQ